MLTGFPGRPIHGYSAHETEADRRTGPHAQPPEPLAGPQLGQYRPNVVMLAYTDAAARDQQVAVERPSEVLAQTLRRVLGDAETVRLTARAPHLREQRMRVAARHLPAAQDLFRLIHVGDLVAAA